MYFCVDKGDTAKEVFIKYYADLYRILTMPHVMSDIAVQLYSSRLISEETYDRVSTRTGRDKADSVLRALRGTISFQPQSLRIFIEILRRSGGPCEAIADKMDRELSLQ